MVFNKDKYGQFNKLHSYKYSLVFRLNKKRDDAIALGSKRNIQKTCFTKRTRQDKYLQPKYLKKIYENIKFLPLQSVSASLLGRLVVLWFLLN